jgi:hypothetical protein
MDISAKIGARIRKKIKPTLEPGESIQQVFLAQSGLNPKWLFPLALVMLFSNKYWVFAVTDRRILIFRASAWIPSAVKDLAVILPRSTRFGSVSGLWGALEIGGTRYWVHRDFQKYVSDADADTPAA